ncbi:MBOAT family protein [Lutimonas saemankumensis]|uniref:MBOAT family O-acyltransferase n=1 Tax=Lutimonas saemankumensis TaxID=483016 RepID=UPI001CD3DC2B|nr:MBOAT family O-acyltransferase [Lutimonas saemankumensis]MCA0932981.1 MBOAT family protein [Lutimonas saemankumensis]
MLFNSIDFAIFLPIVFILYWFVFNKNLRAQNLLVVIASYVFYGWWDWRFLSLIVFSTFVDYNVGIALEKEESKRKRKILLYTSIIVNIGFLAFFKYFNFFVDNFVTFFSLFGQKLSPFSLNIILPVGISFYTFQTLSYTIDVYNKKLDPTQDYIAFSAFVSFFPQLVAGPIERASHLLPQFYRKRNFVYSEASDGLRQILWGLFKKIVIADNCAQYANLIFNNSVDMNGTSLIFGALFFTFQIYGDFSGYSDIAIGISRLFGFDLMKNFSFPYFSRDIAEFWRRWHISLSTWFRDYLYIPLGGSRGGLKLKLRNTFIIFIVSGFWHGANWTFIIWGILNAIYFLPLLISKKNRNHIQIVAKGQIVPSFKDLTRMIFTFLLTVFAWIFFRAENISHALQYITDIFSFNLFSYPNYIGFNKSLIIILITIIFIFIEWAGREGEHALDKVLRNDSVILRNGFYILIIYSLFIFGGSQQEFIYFQF